MAVSIPLVVFFLIFVNSSASKCPESFACGNLISLEYPLSDSRDRPECGLFMVNCTDPANPRIQLTGNGIQYQILEKIYVNKFKLRDPVIQGELRNSQSCHTLRNLSLPFNPSTSLTFSPNLTLLTCHNRINENGKKLDVFKGYKTYTDCGGFTMLYSNSTNLSAPGSSDFIRSCTTVQIPVKSIQDSGDLFDMLTAEFVLEWNVSDNCRACHDRGGQCLDNNLNEFECKKDAPNLTVVIVTGVVSVALVVFIAIIKHTRLQSLRFYKVHKKNEKEIEIFLKNHENFAPRRYKYCELIRITNSLNEKLGKGGYGSVYKGKLHDGRLVAVKILDETKDNVNEFMNEVASISRTSHVNIVTLLGFCFEGSKRALVYEFLPNGSLDKFVNDTISWSQDELDWEKFFQIAVGIAQGLEYLHRGCNMRILHFDIKPHNILLDKDLNPKISDFGLAKLCPNRSSTVSMLVPRGTIGYIAPEVFCRNFGEVSHKSDVYSYGMMVLEIVVGKHNPDTRMGMDFSSETYFPDYVYKQLENCYNVEGIVNENGWKISKRKLIIVGLWCIQTDPKNRPSMNRVLEMLEGNLESLQTPPKPHFSSPTSSAPSIFISEFASAY